jgi:hypothetical protein
LAAGFDLERLEDDFADGFEDERLEDDFAAGLDDEEDFLREPEDFFVSPASARSLFTVRAAISSARPFWPRFS